VLGAASVAGIAAGAVADDAVPTPLSGYRTVEPGGVMKKRIGIATMSNAAWNGAATPWRAAVPLDCRPVDRGPQPHGHPQAQATPQVPPGPAEHAPPFASQGHASL